MMCTDCRFQPRPENAQPCIICRELDQTEEHTELFYQSTNIEIETLKEILLNNDSLQVGDRVKIRLKPDWFGTISWIAPAPKDLYHVESEGVTHRLNRDSLVKA